MMLFRPIFCFSILIFYEITCGSASNVISTEQRLLERNLKVLRNDFNKLVGSLEDLTGDFLLQIHDAGKQMENTYIGNNDYNWQDDNLDTTEKTTKRTHFSLSAITDTPKTTRASAEKPWILHLPKIPNLLTKTNEQQELSNDIEKREKRLTHTVPLEFDNRRSASAMLQDGQQMAASMPENVGQQSTAPVLLEFPPITDGTMHDREGKAEQDHFLADEFVQRSAALSEFPSFAEVTANVKGENTNQEDVLGDKVGQRSSASLIPEFPPFTDRTQNVREDRAEQDNFLFNKGEQRSAASILSQFPPFTDKTTNIQGNKAEDGTFFNDDKGQRSSESKVQEFPSYTAASVLSQFNPFTDRTTNIRGNTAEDGTFFNENQGQRSAGSALQEFPSYSDKTNNVRGHKAGLDIYLTDNVGQRSAAPVLSQFPPFTDKTTNVQEDKPQRGRFFNDNNKQRSAASKLQESIPKSTNVRGDQRKHESLLEAKEADQEKTQTSASTAYLPKQKTEGTVICAQKTQKEMDLESQKMTQLKNEVKKLNELVALLKDQQKLMEVFNEVDKHLENEVNGEKGNVGNDIKNSFLYRTMGQIKTNRLENRINTLMGDDHGDTSNRQDKKPDELEHEPDSTLEDLKKMKMDLRVTAENLNKTKEALLKEKQKEDKFEQELKRQNSELKFLKVMTENLYDKMGNKNNDGKDVYKVDGYEQKLRNSDNEELDVDFPLESVHTPKTMAAERERHSSEISKSSANPEARGTNTKLNSITIHGFPINVKELEGITMKGLPIDFTRPLTRDELHYLEDKLSSDSLDAKWKQDPAFLAYLKKDLMVMHADETREGLRNLAKQEKDAYKKFFPNTNTRESNSEDNRNTNIQELLSLLKQEESKSRNDKNNRNDNGHEIIHNKDAFVLNQLINNRRSKNSTLMPIMSARASSGRVADIDLKLKLLGILAQEEKNDEATIKEKALNEAVKKLLAPEKKSDDDQLDALIALLKEKRDEPNSGSISQDNLKKLLRDLNTKPQSKSDDVDVEGELRQLQKAINSLRPKEDSLFDNLENNRKGKQDDFQSVLSQIVAQNGEGATSPTGVGSNLGGNSNPVAMQELLSQYLASSTTASQKGQLNYGPISSYSGNPDANLYGPSSNHLGPGINSYPKPYYPNPNAYIPNTVYGLETNSYPPNVKSYGTNSNLYGAGSNSYNPTSNIYAPNIRPYGQNPGPYYAYNLRSYGSNLYNPGPYSNPYFGSGKYGTNSGSLYDFNNLGYTSGTASYEYPGQKEYGLGPNYGSNYNLPRPLSSFPGGPNIPYYPESVVPKAYPFNHLAAKRGYQPSEYTKVVPGGYQGGNQGTTKYQNNQGGYSGTGGIVSENSNGFTNAGASYQGSSNAYSGVIQGNKATYGSTAGQNGAVFKNYGRGFFPAVRPSGNIGATYQENNYDPPGYVRPSMDQSYSTGQNDDPYRNALASDLVKQIESLENSIKGLNGPDYRQTPEDMSTVESLEQRIYELKGVISSLNQPSYGPQQSPYQSKQSLYGSKPPETVYVQNQGSNKLPQPYSADQAPYGGLSQNGNPLNTYSSSSQTPYKPSAINEQTQPSNGQISYSYQASSVPSQQSYSTGSQPQTPYVNTSPTQGPSSQPSYTPNQPNSPEQPNQHTDNSPSYQLAPQASSVGYQPTQPENNPAYQPKVAVREDGRITHGAHRDQHRIRSTGNEKTRMKRQTENTQVPQISPQVPFYRLDDDMTRKRQVNNMESPQTSPKVAFYRPNDDMTRKRQVNNMEAPRMASQVPFFRPDVDMARKRQVDNMEASQMSLQVPYYKDDTDMTRKRQVDNMKDPQMPSQVPFKGPEVDMTRKRQDDNMEGPEMTPHKPSGENDPDMAITIRQNYDRVENRPAERTVGYNLGDDSLTQVANIFKKYLEENLTADDNNSPKQYSPTNNQENRNSAATNLQEKLDFLKKQLESRQQSGRSLSNYYVPPGIAFHNPPAPIPFASNNLLNNQFKSPGITSLEKPIADKTQDIFTQIVLKILEKVLGALPSVLNRLFGNLATSVGNSYGDDYSPLQNVFKNLGAVGFIPLILIRFLDTAGVIVPHLGKNKFFKNFLLPAGTVAIAGLGILFLVYFYKQSEPYGYIDYQGGSSKYPKYESSSYGYNNYEATDYSNHGNYRSHSYDIPNHRSYTEPPTYYSDYNRQIPNSKNLRAYNNPRFDSNSIENFNVGEGNVPLQYSRGYYDYFDDRSTASENKNVYR